jgi:hypothetical protein
MFFRVPIVWVAAGNAAATITFILGMARQVPENNAKAYIISKSSITALLKEGCGIRSIGRLLSISNITVLRRIVSIAKKIGSLLYHSTKLMKWMRCVHFINPKRDCFGSPF